MQRDPRDGEQIEAVSDSFNPDAAARIARRPARGVKTPFASVVTAKDESRRSAKEEAGFIVAATKGHGCKSGRRHNAAMGARGPIGPSRN